MTVFQARYQALGVDFATSQGKSLASAAANVKGSWVSFGTSNADYSQLVFEYHRAPAGNSVWLLDFAYGDGSGNFVEMIAQNIMGVQNTNSRISSYFYVLPLFIKNNMEILVRGQTAAGGGMAMICALHLEDDLYPNRCYKSVDTYGVDTATSLGTLVDPGGVANTAGSWTAIATASRDYDCLFFTFNNNGYPTIPTANDGLIDFGVGPNGAPTTIIPSTYVGMQGASAQHRRGAGPYFLKVNAGDVIQARMQSTNTTAGQRAMRVAAHGFFNPILGSGGSQTRRGLFKL